jgi:hypothetical protein
VKQVQSGLLELARESLEEPPRLDAAGAQPFDISPSDAERDLERRTVRALAAFNAAQVLWGEPRACSELSDTDPSASRLR